jgi:hypothetical protein
MTTQIQITIEEIAKRLVDFCRKGDWEGAHKTLYAVDAKSIESYETADFPKEVSGLEAIRAKGIKFDTMIERVYGIKVSEPLITESFIAFTLAMDMDMKGMGRMNSPELCVYQVKEGKIISEQFFM